MKSGCMYISLFSLALFYLVLTLCQKLCRSAKEMDPHYWAGEEFFDIRLLRCAVSDAGIFTQGSDLLVGRVEVLKLGA